MSNTNYRKADIHRNINRIERSIREAIKYLELRDLLNEIDLSDKLGPDPEAMELDRIDRGIDLEKRKSISSN